MSIKNMIESAVSPVVPEIARGEYTGEGDVFCVWDAVETPDAFADNRAAATKFQIQLHLCIPFEDEEDPQTWIDRVRSAIQHEDLFSTPTVEPVETSDDDGYRLYVFEFEGISLEVI